MIVVHLSYIGHGRFRRGFLLLESFISTMRNYCGSAKHGPVANAVSSMPKSGITTCASWSPKRSSPKLRTKARSALNQAQQRGNFWGTNLYISFRECVSRNRLIVSQPWPELQVNFHYHSEANISRVCGGSTRREHYAGPQALISSRGKPAPIFAQFEAP